jgi:hypothetical protein
MISEFNKTCSHLAPPQFKDHWRVDFKFKEVDDVFGFEGLSVNVDVESGNAEILENL